MRVIVVAITGPVVLAALAGCEEQQAFVEPEPGLERMLEQPRVDPFSASSFYGDGIAMRHPPPKTITVERTVDLTDSGASADRIPISVDRALVERGRLRFEVFCATCHGIAGDGVSVVAENMRLRKPPSLHEDRIRTVPDGRIYEIIRSGYGLMPGYAVQLSIEDRWATVAYLRALQISRRSDVRSLPPDVRAELEGAHR